MSCRFIIALSVLSLTACGVMLGNYNVGIERLNEHKYDQAAYYFKKSAANGEAQGEFALGFLAENGYGTPKNGVQACDWYAKAANQGLAEGLNGTARCYEHPHNPYYNLNTAISLYTLAARKGCSAAQVNLARLGRPIPAADLVPQPQAAPQSNSSDAALVALALASGAAKGYGAAPAPTYVPPANNLRCTSQVNGQVVYTNCN